MTQGLFITGTDTNVGKTAVAVSILKQSIGQRIDCRAYKPVASGVQGGLSDIERLWQATEKSGNREDVCPQAFQLAVAPEQAAAAEEKQIDEGLLRKGLSPHGSSKFVLIEGAGGLFSPLSHQTLNVDLAREFQVPIVLVDRSHLGAIGRTLMAVTAAESVGLTVAAVVLSQTEPCHPDNPQMPDSSFVIARQAREELQRRLPQILICWLGYESTSIEPYVDWFKKSAHLQIPM